MSEVPLHLSALIKLMKIIIPIRREIMKFVEKLMMHRGKITVLTGAGVSTPSGIPDFRSPNGIYSKYDPEKLFGLRTFMKDPSYFYSFAIENIFTMKSATPNIVHTLIAYLEEKGFIKGVITQNIDMLHEKAGSKNIAEVHGNIKTGHCVKCGKLYSLEDMENRAKKSFDKVARCDCTGLIKPDIVFFEEMLPETEIKKAYKMLEDSTLIVTMGTSLSVYPAASFPQVVLRNGGELVILNATSTPLDSFASEIEREPLEEFAKRVFSDIKKRERKIN